MQSTIWSFISICWILIGIPLAIIPKTLILLEKKILNKLRFSPREVTNEYIKKSEVLITRSLGMTGIIAGVLIFVQVNFQLIMPYDNTYLEYSCKTPLELPFAGEWKIVAGGKNPINNHHSRNRSQRYAYDFLVVDEQGNTHTGDPNNNKSYFAFARPILSPAKGEIVQVVDGVKDNNPGVMNSYFVPGNMVIIDHGNSEYSVLAHFKYHSIKVKVNDTVLAGDQLGNCGNSGNSSEPHIHYHLQNSPNILTGKGLPPTFHNYMLGKDKKISNGTPESNSSVTNLTEKLRTSGPLKKPLHSR